MRVLQPVALSSVAQVGIAAVSVGDETVAGKKLPLSAVAAFDDTVGDNSKHRTNLVANFLQSEVSQT